MPLWHQLSLGRRNKFSPSKNKNDTSHKAASLFTTMFVPPWWICKVTVKPSRYTPWRRLGGEGYSFYSFTTSALDGGEWSASRPGRALPPGKGPPVPIGEEGGWAPEPVWTQRIEEKSFVPAGDRTPVVQPVVRHYTAWATPDPTWWICSRVMFFAVSIVHVFMFDAAFLYSNCPHDKIRTQTQENRI
jgi:hypothetical protein